MALAPLVRPFMVDLFRFYRALAIAAGFVPAGTEECLMISSGFIELSLQLSVRLAAQFSAEMH